MPPLAGGISMSGGCRHPDLTGLMPTAVSNVTALEAVMPGTLWSAPSSSQLQGSASLTVSSFVTGTLTDISPSYCPISGLNPGTRIRLHAAGNYTATTTASFLTWGFYLSAVGTAISATASAALAATASAAAVVATAWPFILDYSGVVNAVSVPQNSTTAKITGQGWSLLPASLTTFTGPVPMPQTAAARTVTQTATITGLNTSVGLYASLGLTVAVNTGLTNVVVDELTCELIG